MKALVPAIVWGLVLLGPVGAQAVCPIPSPPNIINCDVWLDTDGDGLPGPGGSVFLGTPITFDLWIDSKSFEWTGFSLPVSFGVLGQYPRCFRNTGVHVTYYLPDGGIIFPEDNFTNPSAFSIGGLMFPPQSGVMRMATITTSANRLAGPDSPCCLTPIVSTDAYEEFYCTLTTVSTYALFCEGLAPGVCYTVTGTTPAQSVAWGTIKALFR